MDVEQLGHICGLLLVGIAQPIFLAQIGPVVHHVLYNIVRDVAMPTEAHRDVVPPVDYLLCLLIRLRQLVRLRLELGLAARRGDLLGHLACGEHDGSLFRRILLLALPDPHARKCGHCLVEFEAALVFNSLDERLCKHGLQYSDTNGCWNTGRTVRRVDTVIRAQVVEADVIGPGSSVSSSLIEGRVFLRFVTRVPDLFVDAMATAVHRAVLSGHDCPD